MSETTTTAPTRSKGAKRRRAEKTASTKVSAARTTIGWREWVGLPDLGIDAVKAKIDTGARTSAIHAWNIEPFERDGALHVAFELHPIQRDNRTVVRCTAPVVASREVRNSGGAVEVRFVIETRLRVGKRRWKIELTLTNRDEMGFRMLLGRTAIRRRRLTIDPGRSFLLGRPQSARKSQQGDRAS